MDLKKIKKGNKECEILSRDGGLKDILVCSPDLSVEDFLESNAGFVWVEVAGVRVYSCYFSPNNPFGSSRPSSSFLRKASARLLGGLAFRIGDWCVIEVITAMPSSG